MSGHEHDVDESALAERLKAVRERMAQAALRARREPEDVRLVAVTKRVHPSWIRAANALGVSHFGENRVQEGLAHQDAWSNFEEAGSRETSDPTWHMIGHLQRNKAAYVVRSFDRLDSLDSLRLATLVSRLATEEGRTLPVLLEVNVSGETSKHGFPPLLPELVASARTIAGLPGLQIEGLMTIGPLHAAGEDVRRAFRMLAELRNGLREQLPTVSWRELSMGMSGDFEAAIEEGATEVRIGSALFGVRSA